MELTTLNNATVLIETHNKDKFCIDPWLIGNLYWNCWKPSISLSDRGKKFIKNLNYLFISHIHQDHWDLETIRHFKKDIKVFLPNLPFLKKVIGEKLLHLGIQDINYIELFKDTKVNDLMSFSIIPPLNSFGQESNDYFLENDNLISIDTSILVNDHQEKLSHIFLCDNTPYNPKSSQIIAKANNYNYPISTIWYPYNGSAHDYPLCYDNYDLKEKKNIAKKMYKTRNENIIKLVKSTKSGRAIPYSSDFIYSGKRAKEFIQIFSEKLSRSFSTEYNNKISKTNKFLYLEQGTTLYPTKSEYKLFKSDFSERSTLKSKSEIIPNEKKYSTQSILKKLFEACTAAKERYQKINMNIPKLPFFLYLEDQKSTIECNLLENKFQINNISITNVDQTFDEYIYLKISSNNLYLWLNSTYHIDNLTISGCLTWYRKTKSNMYPRDFYDFLNFFHT